MELIPRRLPTGPKPVCAGPNCGAEITSNDQSLDEITCPCGYGYYDKVNHKFVPGSLVRSGQAPSRADYVSHVRQCSKKERGAPVLGVVYVGQEGSEPQGVVYLGATGGRPQAWLSNEPPATRRHKTTQPDAHRFDSYTDADRSVPSRHHSSDGHTRSLFLNRNRVEPDPLILYLQLLNAEARVPFQWREDVVNGEQGWTVTGPKPLPNEAARDIVQDSENWRREAIAPASAGVSYSKSKTAEKRKKKGVVSLDDEQPQIGTQKAILSSRTLGQTAQSRRASKKSQRDESPEDGDDGSVYGLQDRIHPENISQAKDLQGRSSGRESRYGLDDDVDMKRLAARSKFSTSNRYDYLDNDRNDDDSGSRTTGRNARVRDSESGSDIYSTGARHTSNVSTSGYSDRYNTTDSKPSRHLSHDEKDYSVTGARRHK